jgi:hypothetical protein
MISTVVVDKLEDYTTVLVDDKGFYPQIVNVEQVCSLFNSLFLNDGCIHKYVLLFRIKAFYLIGAIQINFII